jgi:type IV pilus assembly protein PilB
MFDSRNAAILDLCRSYELVDESILENLSASSEELERSVASLLVEQGHVSRRDLLERVARFLSLEYRAEIPPDLPDDVVSQLSIDLARMYGVVPIESLDTVTIIAASDPFNDHLVDDLSFAVGKDVQIIVADPKTIGELLDVYYRFGDADYKGILEEIDLVNVEDEEVSLENLLNMAGETPIIRFVNLVLSQAIRDKASDVHFEPFENEFKIRYRIDGALYEMSPPPRELAIPIISRIKVIGNLNIAERRVPQDGKVRLTVAGRSVDLRISTLPTQFGESVVLRVLDQSATTLELDSLGMPPDIVEVVAKTIALPNGIFIVTGPTGSGKTTTLYSCLKRLNKVGNKLMTAEDPIEYEIDGIMQTAINSAIDLTFANALKAFLRQDPDIIMVGEIRDLETAQIAIQASLTGHLVLSTLHTNDAAGAVTRLMDMGIEEFLIASSIEAVLAQRLLRRICMDCRREHMPSVALIEQLELDPAMLANRQFYAGRGCDNCAKTGYRGRLGIFEILEITESIRELIAAGEPSAVIRERAIQQGMRTLREDGLRSIFTGATSVEEVIRYT